MSGADDRDGTRPAVQPVDLSTPRRIHIVGVGGAGMRAITRILLAMGHEVTGSDRASSDHVDALERLGARVWVGHAAAHLGDTELVTRSTAVGDDNVEIVAAFERGIPVLSRADVLAAISRRRPSILVAGTHGKTTTASMLAVILEEAGRTPSFVIGSDVARFGTGARWVDGPEQVIEADESDGTFLALDGAHAIVTSLDPDHLEFYGSATNLREAFVAFVRRVDGVIAVCRDDPDTNPLLDLPGVVTYGTDADADLRISTPLVERDATVFDMTWKATPLGSVSVALTGAHNALNAAGAAAIALELGVGVEPIRRGLRDFTGVARRFERRGRATGVDFIDDYAHLPAEVEAAIATARSGGWTRVVVTYQPHRYSRTEALGATFASSFSGADHLVLTGIYPAGETPRPGVTGRIVHDAVRAAGRPPSVEYCETLAEVEDHLVDVLRPGDLCLTLGAGDLTALPDRVRDRLAGDFVDALAASVPSSTVTPGEPIGPRTTYRVGGPAFVHVDVGDLDDLRAVGEAASSAGLPVLGLGRGSNLLVSDAGYDGVVIQLGAAFERIEVEGTTVRAGAAVALPALARQTVAAGLGGFEWAVGVPGSIGGAVRMNAGGHGSDMAASLRWADVLVTATGTIERRPVEQLDLGYRSSAITADEIVVGVELELERSDAERGAELLAEIVRWRRDNQPGGQNAGSVFTNPIDDSAGRLIDAAGGKGRRVGSAEVSAKHANFIQVDPSGSADDVFELMLVIAELVERATGVVLEPETRMVGFHPDWNERRRTS